MTGLLTGSSAEVAGIRMLESKAFGEVSDDGRLQGGAATRFSITRSGARWYLRGVDRPSAVSVKNNRGPFVIQEPVIDLATRDDAALIARMSRTEIEYGLPWSWTGSRVAQAMRDPETNVAVVRESEALAAFGIMRYRETTAHLSLLAVRASRRRAGLGSAVLFWLEHVARTAGIAAIRLEARSDNPAALAFYEHHGYATFARRTGMYFGRVDGHRLEKILRRTE